MKKLVFIFTILCSGLIFSQEIITDIIVKSERIAEFPDGGSQNFRKLIEDNFRGKKVKGEGKESCELKFVVERDGSLSNITANGLNESFNKEAIRAISKIKTKWIPATFSGQPVRYRFRIPLNLDFN